MYKLTSSLSHIRLNVACNKFWRFFRQEIRVIGQRCPHRFFRFISASLFNSGPDTSSFYPLTISPSKASFSICLFYLNRKAHGILYKLHITAKQTELPSPFKVSRIVHFHGKIVPGGFIVCLTRHIWVFRLLLTCLVRFSEGHFTGSCPRVWKDQRAWEIARPRIWLLGRWPYSATLSFGYVGLSKPNSNYAFW